jgi:hypothetical protein
MQRLKGEADTASNAAAMRAREKQLLPIYQQVGGPFGSLCSCF